MAKTNFKIDRLAESIKYSINDIINDEIDSINFVTITEVEITKDLVDAKIYIQTLDLKEANRTIEKLTKASGFIKKRLAQNVKMRRIPNLIFKYDNSLDNYNKIDDLLNKV